MTRAVTGAATTLRLQAIVTSEAPRYISLTSLAQRKKVEVPVLTRWRHTGSTPVLGEDIRLGTDPGWDPERADPWTPGCVPDAPPTPVLYWPAAEMLRRYHVSLDTLWTMIMLDRRLPMPAIWLDDRPGWEPEQ
ncbi:hypothetical protein AB0H76_15455 [Nocardia sp. NPDC050712]|uniref:hypothetical protein n=1 Tax=Nocardia sp. NPDC050712 TaxID=3155518 RepID=UPI0033DFCF7A